MSFLKLMTLSALLLVASAHRPRNHHGENAHEHGEHTHHKRHHHEPSEFSDLALIAELESELIAEEFSAFSHVFSEAALPPCHPPCTVDAACSDDNPCTVLDACLPTKFGNKCIGRKPLKCPRAPNECHEEAVWEPNCELNTCHCRYAFKPKGTKCRWGSCDAFGACLPNEPFAPYEASELIEELREDVALHSPHAESSAELSEESSESGDYGYYHEHGQRHHHEESGRHHEHGRYGRRRRV